MLKRILRKALLNRLLSKVINISEYKVDFKVKEFLKIFFYHLLFYALGPIALIIIGCLSSFNLAKNMGFMFSTS